MMSSPLLSVSDLSVEFPSRDGWLRVTQDVSFDIAPGEVVGLVGESGSGKTVSAMAIAGLVRIVGGRASGSITFDGRDISRLTERELQSIRGENIGVIFQQAIRSLNPSMKIGKQIAESLRLHRGLNRKAAWQRAVELLDRVGIPEPDKRAHEYPFQFSGGMCQRVMIAMALACEPKLLIADEPTTALDVSVQKRILDLILELKEETGAAVLFITHDLSVVAQLCNRVVVMYSGQVVERGDVAEVFGNPQHPYTQGLLDAIPRGRSHRLVAIPGVVPNPTEVVSGCRFAARCPYMVPGKCDVVPQVLVALDKERAVRCMRAEEISLEGVFAK